MDSSPNGNHGWVEGAAEQVPSSVPLLTELPPLASMLEPRDFGTTSALLRGRVNPRGLMTTAWFEHGRGTNYESATPPQVISAEVGEAIVSAPWTGLLAGAEYHVHLVASNRLGTWVSDSLRFRMPSLAREAVALDGVADYLATPDLGGWFASETLTIEFWFNAEGPGVLLDERGQPPPQDGWQLTLIELLGSGELKARVHQVPEISLGTVAFGAWHHLALRYDKASQRLDGFLDGVKAPTPSSGDRAAPGEHGYRTFWAFGLADSAHMGSGRSFHGAFDEIRVWNLARSDEELERDFAERLTGQEAGLVCYWRCDDLGDGVVRDASGHGHDALPASPPVFVQSRVPPGLPVAVTGPPTVSSSTSAVLNGTVIRSRAPGIAYYEWGASGGYGSRTAPQPVPGGASDLSVSATLTGLTPATVYQARLVVETAEGVGYGAGRSFETNGEGEGMAARAGRSPRRAGHAGPRRCVRVGLDDD